VRDITIRRRAEEEREQAREQLQAILSGVADAVTAQAPDGRLLFANDAALELLGFASFDELAAAPVSWMMDRFDMLDEDGEPLPVEELPGRRALAGEQGAEAVVRFRLRATGDERWSAVKATPIRDEDGFVTMAISAPSAPSASCPTAACCSQPRSTRPRCSGRSPLSRSPRSPTGSRCTCLATSGSSWSRSPTATRR
jgi:PAS domain S-box-containing protein